MTGCAESSQQKKRRRNIRIFFPGRRGGVLGALIEKGGFAGDGNAGSDAAFFQYLK
jgi:hypothetical protein